MEKENFVFFKVSKQLEGLNLFQYKVSKQLEKKGFADFKLYKPHHHAKKTYEADGGRKNLVSYSLDTPATGF